MMHTSKEEEKMVEEALSEIKRGTAEIIDFERIEKLVKRYFENGYGIYTGKIIDVKIEFSKEIAPFIKERIWHKNQKFIENKDGSVLLELPVNSLSEIKKMVLSYGKNAIVIEPLKLKQMIKTEIIEMFEKY